MPVGGGSVTWSVLEGDCVEVMAAMDEASIDAIVTDPPYGLEFMGKEWDRIGADLRQPFRGEVQTPDNPYGRTPVRYPYGVPGGAMQEWHHAWAVEALRVLKPGGHLLAFGGTRTYHRLTCALEDAGFEIRDSIADLFAFQPEIAQFVASLNAAQRDAFVRLLDLAAFGGPLLWLYGSGFPKSLDVSKAIDKAAGAEREVIGVNPSSRPNSKRAGLRGFDNREGADAVGSAGVQTITAPVTPDALRWQGWGTALKPAFEPIVLARKPLSERNVAANVQRWGTGALNIDGCRIDTDPHDASRSRERSAERRYGDRGGTNLAMTPGPRGRSVSGRWPANVAVDEEAAALLDEQSGESRSRAGHPRSGPAGDGWGMTSTGAEYADAGGASRFFYTAKASRSEREIGRMYGTERNAHPTVKPVELMRWLVRLVTPPGGTVLDPFAGSGSTGIAALREGFDFIGIEREAEYVEIARARIIGDAPLLNAPAEMAQVPSE